MADLIIMQLRQLLQLDSSRVHSRIYPKCYDDVVQASVFMFIVIVIGFLRLIYLRASLSVMKNDTDLKMSFWQQLFDIWIRID